MKILITGAAGFIGSVLSEKLLSGGHSLIGIDNFDPFYPREIKFNNLKELQKSDNFRFFELDITRADQFAQLPTCDLAIHLAAKAGVRPSILNPEQYIKANIEGTFNLLEWLKNTNCQHLIFASSSSVYGNNKKVPFSEYDNVDQPISPYALTKKSGELLTYNYHHLYGIKVINFRFFTVYGPRQRPDLAIHKFFNSLKNDVPIEIYGNGKTGRDYTYVDDIVSGIISGIDYLSNKRESIYEIINLGNNNPVALFELIATIEKVTKKKFRTLELPMQPGDVELTFADISKAKQLLNYSPSTNLITGLEQFKLWYEKNQVEFQS